MKVRDTRTGEVKYVADVDVEVVNRHRANYVQPVECAALEGPVKRKRGLPRKAV